MGEELLKRSSGTERGEGAKETGIIHTPDVMGFFALWVLFIFV